MNKQDKQEKKIFQKAVSPILSRLGTVLNAPLGRWIENDTLVLIVSAILAILLWLMVVFANDEYTTAIIRDVPVSFNTTSSSLSSLKLYPVAENEFSVDVEVYGKRSVIGNITKDDLLATAKTNNVTEAGAFTVGINVADSSGRSTYEIKSTTPDTLSVRFDYTREKTFQVELETDGGDIPEGYWQDEKFVTPTEVTVTGPETEVSSIAECRATLVIKEQLTSTKAYDVKIVPYDSEGNVIDSPYVELNPDTVTVTLPVLKIKTVPVTFDFINVPSTFDTSTLSYTIEPAEIEIAGPESSIDSVTELHAGYIDMQNFTPDFPFLFNVELPSSFVSVNEKQQALVTFIDTDDYETRTFNVSDIRVVNQPEDYDVTVSTKTIYDVEITGPAEALDTLTASNIVAEIDMSNVDIRTGQSTVNVTILTPTTDSCWSSGGACTAVITVRSR